LGHLINIDWKRDSKGKEKVSKIEMIDALFELADIWTRISMRLSMQPFLKFYGSGQFLMI